jgi:hypothetical protein
VAGALLLGIAFWAQLAAESPATSSAAGAHLEPAASTAGRHFVVVEGGGDSDELAIGTTQMRVPPGTLVSFEPGGLATSLDGACVRWDLMARFGGRTVGDTRLLAGSWTDGTPTVAGSPAWVATRPEPMTWAARCYDSDGLPVSLPPFTARIEFVTATPFS